MFLTFLGRGSAFCPELGNTSACFTADGRLVLLDCGETVFFQLYQRNALAQAAEIYVYLTHLHADHVGSLATLISYCWYVLHRQVNVIYPAAEVLQLLDLMGIERCCYRYTAETPAALQGVAAEPIPVQHVPDMPCFGYRFTVGDVRFYYSGDASALPAEIPAQLADGSLDFICQDTASAPSGHHCWVEELCRAVPAPLRSRVYCMHLDTPDGQYCTSRGFRIV